jgi:hypothetical protein
MHDHPNLAGCPARRREVSHRRERGVRAVVALTATMMVLEIIVGYAYFKEGDFIQNRVRSGDTDFAYFELSHRFF